jgi:hypothetical protein
MRIHGISLADVTGYGWMAELVEKLHHIDPEEIKAKLTDLAQRTAKEGKDTGTMMETGAQFLDVLRTVGLGFLAVAPIPGAGLLMVVLVKIGHHYGIELIPRAFR